MGPQQDNFLDQVNCKILGQWQGPLWEGEDWVGVDG